ncbi:MAG: sigma-70 family RNA polymerase sigma factor [bacterium]|nr:sigma-70 family RNA polymerase sigma factor [bacterium]
MNPQVLDSTDLTWLARLARALLGEANAADDLVQETAVAALRSELPPVQRRAWLAAVARRLAARHVRGEARRARRERNRERTTPVLLPDTSELVARAEVAEQVTGAAQRLPEPFRRTILLRFLEGLSPDEIARRDGKPVDTVRWRVRRGLELLRRELVRGSDRDWAAWSVLLVPLARTGEVAGPATAGVTATLGGTVAALIAMKATTLLAATLLGTAGLLVWITWTPDTDSAGPPNVAAGAAVAARPAQRVAAEPPTASSSEIEPDRTAVAAGPMAPTTPAAAAGAPLFGRVVDEAGEPVPGATVYLVAAETGGDRGPVQRTQSDTRGGFRLAGHDSEEVLDLGVAANGYVRAAVPQAWPDRTNEELVVVLARGRRVRGVVVDEFDRPVPALELLCHTAHAGIDHVSLSQVELRSERALFGNAKSTYGQCRRRTDRNGIIELTGLPVREGLVVRSLDPAWAIANSRLGFDDAGYITWRAKRRLGVRLRIVDERTGRPIRSARATFRMELTFADGEVEEHGQWVGRGRGGATFVLTPEILPGLDERKITSAVFYGEAGTRQVKVPWRAEPIRDARGATGVADVQVLVDSSPVGGPEAPPRVTTTLDLDVRHTDGSPFDGELSVDWRATVAKGSVIEDDVESAQRLRPGRYRVEVDIGDVELRVAERFAAGSLPPWTGAVRCEAGRSALAFATLPRGGAVRITQPDGWRGTWYVRASWRPSPASEWRGSWNYGTNKDALVLTAMRPVEWRFELSRDSGQQSADLVRTALLFEGADVLVDR